MNVPSEGKPSQASGPLARLMASLKVLVEPPLSVEDRREAGRVATDYEVAFITETGETGTGVILDISRRGMRLRTPRPLTRGITIALKAPTPYLESGHSSLMAKVMWIRPDGDSQSLAGLLLPPGMEDEETWLEAALASRGFTGGDEQRRKYVRAEGREFAARLVVENEADVAVTVLNLGMGGALIRADRHFPAETSFRLHLASVADLPDLELGGVVLRNYRPDEATGYLHATRFLPLEARRHTLLKEYVVALLKKP